MTRTIMCFLALAYCLVSVFLFVPVFSEGSTLVITEIAAFESTGYEWIEVLNVSQEPIDMSSVIFWEAGVHHGLRPVNRETAMLFPSEYAIITQNDALFLEKYGDVGVLILDSSWGSLNERGEEIGLKSSLGDLFFELFTYVPAPDGVLERIDPLRSDYSVQNWQEHVSQHSAGGPTVVLDQDEELPVVIPSLRIVVSTTSIEVGDEVSFSAEVIPEIPDAQYMWNLGDGTTMADRQFSYMYTTPQTVTVLVTVQGNFGEVSTSTLLTILSSQSDEPVQEEIIFDTPSIGISEVYPVAASSTSEWVELYSLEQISVSLDGWSLVDESGNTFLLSGVIDPNTFVSFDMTRALFNNSGDTVQLRDPNGKVIDHVRYGKDDTAMVSVPTLHQSIARIFSLEDNDVFSFSFVLVDTPTKGLVSISQTLPVIDMPVSSTSSSVSRDAPVITEGVIVINEIVSDPADGEEEFVELYHRGSVPIDLSSWWIEDGSETKTVLSGMLKPGEFFVVLKPKGSLNNSGDSVSLYAPMGILIDDVSYGVWDDGSLNDNAPVAVDPQSVARIRDGQDSDYDRHDFAVTLRVTKGTKNSIHVSEDIDKGTVLVPTGVLFISEIFANPKGDDSDSEFIELVNTGKTEISLNGWALGDMTEKRFRFTKEVIAPQGRLTIFRKTTGIALNNSGEEQVRLFSPQGVLVDSITYRGTVADDVSYARSDDGLFVWTTQATPQAANVILKQAIPPVIIIDDIADVVVGEPIVFDASDTYDPDGDIRRIEWNFGNGHIFENPTLTFSFATPGQQEVSVVAIDTEGNSSTTSLMIDVLLFDGVGGYVSSVPVENLVVSEVFPNPPGADTEEFIELYNPTDTPIDISFFRLDDSDGGSRPYHIPAGTIIQPDTYEVFFRDETRLALNNSSDSVRILYPDHTVALELLFDDIVDGASYAFDGQDWCWTVSSTPGALNYCEVALSGRASKIAKGSAAVSVPLSQLRDADVGDRVITRGVVSVLPGVLSSQYMYISQTDMPGVQVYLYNKSFPSLLVGDMIEVTGELSEVQGETRIKIKEATDIDIVGRGHEVIPLSIAIVDISEVHEGSLLRIEGEVTEAKGSYLYVDDGTQELKVYMKKSVGISTKQFGLGTTVQVVGILGQTDASYQLLPRSIQDIVVLPRDEEDMLVNQETQMVVSSSFNTVQTYLTVTAGGLTSIIVGLVMKARQALLIGCVRRTIHVVQSLFRMKG